MSLQQLAALSQLDFVSIDSIVLHPGSSHVKADQIQPDQLRSKLNII